VVEQTPEERRVVSSILTFGTKKQFGRLAQLVEHLVYTERVTGSSPVAPTIKKHTSRVFFGIVVASFENVTS
jgi:hypothetical protein